MEIDYLLFKRRYRDIEEITGEYDYSVEEFVNSRVALMENCVTLDLTQWTDGMLEDKLDEAFYRYSMFDNYLIEEKLEEI